MVVFSYKFVFNSENNEKRGLIGHNEDGNHLYKNCSYLVDFKLKDDRFPDKNEEFISYCYAGIQDLTNRKPLRRIRAGLSNTIKYVPFTCGTLLKEHLEYFLTFLDLTNFNDLVLNFYFIIAKESGQIPAE